MLRSELSGKVTAQRKSDEMDAVESERIEQFHVVHHIIMERIHFRIIAGFAEAGVIGMDDVKTVGPGLRDFEAMKRPGTVQEKERLAGPACVDDGVDAVDLEGLLCQFGHGVSPDLIPPRSWRHGSWSPERAASLLQR